MVEQTPGQSLPPQGQPANTGEVTAQERAEILGPPDGPARPWSRAARSTALSVFILLVPAGLLGLSLLGRHAGLAMPSMPIVVVAALVSLAIVVPAARKLAIPASFETSLAIVALGVTNFIFRENYVWAIPRYGPYIELLALAVLAMGASGIVAGLWRRRHEDNPTVRFGAMMGMIALLWAFAIACTHLFVRNGGGLDRLWLGPWAVGLSFVLLGGGLVFVRPARPGRRASPRAFGVVMMSMAAAAALAGLFLAGDYPRGLLVSLAAVFIVAGLVGTYRKSRGIRVFRAVASVTFPLWTACWAATGGGVLGGRTSVVGLLSDPVTAPDAAAGFAIGAMAVYLFGLLLIPRDKRWTESVPLVAGLALGVVGYCWLAFVGGAARLPIPWAGVALTVDSLHFIYFQSAVLMITAWRVRWEPTVYLAALGLLAAVGIDLAGHAQGDFHQLLRDITTTVALVGAALAAVGAVVGLWRHRRPLARFYCEGLLVMGLASAALMALLAGIGAFEVGLTDESLLLLGALALTLLLNAMTFRQEDLFGFFGLAVLMIVLAAFARFVGPRPGVYLFRYATAAAVAGIGLAITAAVAARVVRDHKSFRHFGAALYVSAFVAATIVLVLVSQSIRRTPGYCGLDLLGVALILALMRPHVRHPATGYAVIAAISAAVYTLMSGRWATSPITFLHVTILATAAVAVLWIAVSLAVRRLAIRFWDLPDKLARAVARPFTVVAMTTACVLAVYLTVLTVLGYQTVIHGAGPWSSTLLLGRVTPEVIVLAWGGVLLTFLLSIWVFRHSLRTLVFFVLGNVAVVSTGLLFDLSPLQLRSYLICSIAGFGAAHLLVYLWERPYMRLLSRVCTLYRDEKKASTTIFTASCISCFIGAIIAAFFLHTLAAVIMLWILTGVFFAWCFGRRRSELLYPAVLMSVGALVAIWHHAEGPGRWEEWSPNRVNINALVFAAGGLLWLLAGTLLNRLRGPMSVLHTPARQMSVVLAMASLGFYFVLALAPLSGADGWAPDDSALRFILGGACGVGLVAYFVWAATSFRRMFLVYWGELAVAALASFVAIRVPAVWESEGLHHYWPIGIAGLALAMVATAKFLEWRKRLLFAHPIFFTAVLVLPLAPLLESLRRLFVGEYVVPLATIVLLAVIAFVGMHYRLAARWRSRVRSAGES